MPDKVCMTAAQHGMWLSTRDVNFREKNILDTRIIFPGISSRSRCYRPRLCGDISETHWQTRRDGKKGGDCHQLQQQHSNRSAGLTGGCGPVDRYCESSVHHFTIIPSLSPHPLRLLVMESSCHPMQLWGESQGRSHCSVCGRQIIASSNYKCVDTSWAIDSLTWLLTQWILWYAVVNGILVDEKYFSCTQEKFSRLNEIESH